MYSESFTAYSDDILCMQDTKGHLKGSTGAES